MNCALCQTPIEEAAGIVDGNSLCSTCYNRVVDYVSRVENRLERLQKRADKAQSEASATINRARDMASVIPFGQPILVGHHSERRDRNYRDKIDRTFRRGFETLRRAETLQRRASSAESNDAIRSDDPLAVIKMREKIAERETAQEWMKKANREVRKVMKLPADQRAAALAKALGKSEEYTANLLRPDDLRRIGYPDYMLSNNNGNIRRMKDRLAELEKLAQRAATEEVTQEQVGSIKIVRDAVDNRLRLIFPGKPSEEHRKVLKSYGFIWSGANGAWQRQLNNAAEYAAQQVIKVINGGVTND